MSMLTTGEVAKKLGVSRDALLNALRHNLPKPARMGKFYTWAQGDIDRARRYFEAKKESRVRILADTFLPNGFDGQMELATKQYSSRKIALEAVKTRALRASKQ